MCNEDLIFVVGACTKCVWVVVIFYGYNFTINSNTNTAQFFYKHVKQMEYDNNEH